MTDDRTALVLGGGGVTGIAWATGLLLGLERGGLALRDADRIIGTSAGAAVGAQLTGPLSLDDLYDRQLCGVVRELPGGLSGAALLRIGLPVALRHDAAAALRSIGRFAASRAEDRREARRHVIEQRLDGADWASDRDLGLTAIDIDSGERVVFTAGGPASLADAVEASCAVPGVWPVVTIDGHRYMDGGMRSPANVDLADGASQAVVIAPMPRAARKDTAAQVELSALGIPGAVLSPDEQSRAAIGTNALDPSARTAAAQAGLAQAVRDADAVAAVWG
ncbi:patatin-like phospholipase family protein [Microbacterium pseudoresistens]|uniref:NTE family protein n=1 Tax=Microbacterium pseudoresistens TaxID=640634 RepID=A0A7Y9EWK8_9MICO|nr:patatin-like phospholipase family protein [Microbacterium pseudoresistens]NYD55159.1 NTE family protein [Microbacterium pseudoresistens]